MPTKILPLPKWQLQYRSQRGLSHEHRSEKCQDACIAFQRGRYLAFALADGAGSAPCGGLGARRAVAASRSWLEAKLPSPANPNWRVLLRDGVSEVRSALEEVARTKRLPIEDLACTLLLGALTPTAAIVAHLGDGGAVLRNRRGELQLLSLSEREGAANLTAFLTGDQWEDNLCLSAQRGEFTGFAAFSDGLEAGAVNGERKPHPGFFEPLFAMCSQKPAAAASKELRDFLSSDHLRAHTDDDCTLIIAALREEKP